MKGGENSQGIEETMTFWFKLVMLTPQGEMRNEMFPKLRYTGETARVRRKGSKLEKSMKYEENQGHITLIAVN